ncbi:[FeFe] hydrogenase H-cluster radical SAM maturase HydE [Uliginosibacterium gangwonense]|uniref:[FeFe] hydrogenase H-cluster radical SAM maturase HydE n=1 Tax=Uliginosibacterium gangwonense TaxID=392736 RepID=UPI00036A16A4|nr:[FeFe] hydrogenase H-cluster radical SAM maturase HydE [Uliginosibacterium gangwonense]
MSVAGTAVRINWQPRPDKAKLGLVEDGFEFSASDIHAGFLDRETLHRILAAQSAQNIETIRRAAEKTLLERCGDTVRLRGLVEFSNRCVCDCNYCGIRRSNRAVKRYTLSLAEIVECAQWCAAKGYGSLVLQAGERRDEKFAAFVAEAVRAIKAETCSTELPEGLGITLCVGEQSEATYARWFEAGAHRYLLRMESFKPALFAALHPREQTYAARREALATLKRLGYQVGTGVMIGLPGQSLDDLVDDLLAFRDLGVDMIGMGPYIPHVQAPLGGADQIGSAQARLGLSLRMIAAARLLLKNVNIAATTALQALSETGREQGLRFGANVIMPQVTPVRVRSQYTLYDGKPCLDDNAEQCCECLRKRIESVGRRVLYQAWGDSAHFAQRRALAKA